jgi:transposase
MYQERLRDLGESKLTARRQVGAVLDINQATLRNWVEREEIDTGARPGVTTGASEEVKALRREVAELRRANEILKTASAFFAAAELDRRLR